ncbi:hypothetical protein Tco_0158545 [Tanacetum coccineum]
MIGIYVCGRWTVAPRGYGRRTVRGQTGCLEVMGRTEEPTSRVIPSELHIPLWPNLEVLQIGIRAKVIENQNGLSWGIPLVNADELLEMDPYEEVAQQGQAHPLSPAYVPDPIKLDEHVEDQPYTNDASPTTESPRHIADSESIEKDSIDYPDEPEDDDEDLEEDPEEDHTDYPADGEDGNDEPSDDDDDDDDTNDKDEEPTEEEEEEEHLALADPSEVPIVDPVPSTRDTEKFKTDESAPTPSKVPFSQTRLRRAWKTVRLEPPMSASMEARIANHAAAPIPPTSPAYDQAPLGHRAAMICMRDNIPKEDMPPQRRFVLTAPPPRCDVVESSVAAAARPPKAADRAEDVGYVCRQESEDFYTQLHAARTDRRDIRLEIDVNRALLARLETLKTHMSRMEWQRQRAEDDAVRQMMRTHVLEARAHIDTVEDTDSSC